MIIKKLLAGGEMSKQNEKAKTMGLVISNLQDEIYFYNKGMEAYRSKSLVKAQRYLERAVKLNPNEPVFNCQLAIIHAELGEFYRANDYLMNIINNKLGDEMPECYFFLANNFANLGLFEHARKEALTYIEKAPDGEFIEDIEDLLELLQEEDDLFAEAEMFLIHYEIASLELKKQNYQKAISYFSELINEKPHYWMAHIRLAEAYYCAGNSKRALKILQAVLEKENHLIARCHYMIYSYEIGEIENAQLIAKSLENVWSIDDEQNYSLAVSFGKIGLHQVTYARLAYLKQKGFGDFPMFDYHLGVAAFYTGRIDKALKVWEKLASYGNETAITSLYFLQEESGLKPTYHYSGSYRDH